MHATIRPEDLLAGPRGRRLCLSAAIVLEPAIWSLQPMFSAQPLGLEVRQALAAAIARVDPAQLAREPDELRMLEPLAAAVDMARYWQPPDEEDAITETAELREVLLPIAAALLSAPSAAWWSSGLTLDQRYVEWGERSETRLDLGPAQPKLARWRAATIADEVEAASRPSDLAAPRSGEWWSSPVNAGLPRTRRALPGLGSVGLPLEEDGFGEKDARVVPVNARDGIRVYEILTSGDWVDLVARYPLEVTLSRRHDWWRITGLPGPWLIPDWAAVAGDFDVVHLSVIGYLTTAGRAFPVGSSVVPDAHTVLAGWNPDESFWLGDVLGSGAAPSDWRRLAQAPYAWERVEMAG